MDSSCPHSNRVPPPDRAKLSLFAQHLPGTKVQRDPSLHHKSEVGAAWANGLRRIRHNAVWIPRSLFLWLRTLDRGASLERGGTYEGSVMGEVKVWRVLLRGYGSGFLADGPLTEDDQRR